MSLSLSPTITGITPRYLGATEAGGFWPEDLADLGINTYRLWTKMAELEWWDDDDAVDGQWDDSEYGTPTIPEIKADASSGFSNTVPWAWWDARFDEVQSWRYGVQTRRGIIESLVQNNVTPLVLLRTYDDQGQPEQRPAAEWAPQPPVDEDFRNEWWTHCFAIAYWLNVRNDYQVTHFQVLNEPDYPGQGWQEYGGTSGDYAQLVLYAHDAISYANSFASLPVYLHAPVVADYDSPYVADILDSADAAVQVVDYHSYAEDVRPGIVSLRGTIGSHNPDGTLEPIWNSEWGALWSSYDTFDRAMTTAGQLLTFAEEEVEGATVFNMYDWSTAAGQDYGLIDLQDDGQGGALRVPTESYYAFRLMARGLVGGKEKLAFTARGTPTSTRLLVTRDEANTYLIVLQEPGGISLTINADLSPLELGSGTATVYEYSAEHKDEVVAQPALSAGQLSFTAPSAGLSLAVIPRPAFSTSAKTASTPLARPGQLLTYTVVLSNSSPVGATQAVLSDTLPAGLVWAGRLNATSGQAGYAAGVVTWTGAISPLNPVTVTFALTLSHLPAGHTLSNSAFLRADQSLYRLGPATTTVAPAPALILQPVDQAGSAPPGFTATYTLTLTNAGNLTDSLSLSLSLSPTPSLHLSSSPPPLVSLSPSPWPALLKPSNLTLPMGASAPLTLAVAVPPGTPAGISATVRITATSAASPSVQATARVTTTSTGEPPTWRIYLPLTLHQAAFEQ